MKARPLDRFALCRAALKFLPRPLLCPPPWCRAKGSRVTGAAGGRDRTSEQPRRPAEIRPPGTSAGGARSPTPPSFPSRELQVRRLARSGGLGARLSSATPGRDGSIYRRNWPGLAPSGHLVSKILAEGEGVEPWRLSPPLGFQDRSPPAQRHPPFLAGAGFEPAICGLWDRRGHPGSSTRQKAFYAPAADSATALSAWPAGSPLTRVSRGLLLAARFSRNRTGLPSLLPSTSETVSSRRLLRIDQTAAVASTSFRWALKTPGPEH